MLYCQKIVLPMIRAFFVFFVISNIFANDSAILNTYGADNLAAKPPFAGGYINFGYWKGLRIDSPVSIKTRILASQNLYRLIFQKLKLESTDRVLEIGCGQGIGLIDMVSTYKPAIAIGIDFTPEQIDRAQNNLISSDITCCFPVFLRSGAEQTPFPSSYFTKIFSVEAAQYFHSFFDFSREAWRILKPNGSIIVTAHFSTSAEGYNQVKRLLPTVAQGVDRTIPIQSVIADLITAGFEVTGLYSIGRDVFYGFDLWLAQVEDAPWGRKIWEAFDKGFLDYYIICARKPLRGNERTIQNIDSKH